MSACSRFCVVSEPSDSDPDLECEEIGAGVLDIGLLDRDLVDHSVQIRDNKGTLVGLKGQQGYTGRFKGTTRVHW